MLENFMHLYSYAVKFGQSDEVNKSIVQGEDLSFLRYDAEVNQLAPALLSARAAGHQRMGVLFSTMNEKEALKQARRYLSQPGSSNRHNEEPLVYSLIKRLGQCLIKSAEACLPTAIVSADTKWSAMSATEQYHYLWENARLLNYREWIDRHPLMFKHQEEYESLAGRRMCHTPMSVLPKQFGRWPENGTRPNCLGISLMLTAWLDLIGADYLYFNLIKNRQEVCSAYSRQTYRQILDFTSESPIDFRPDFLIDCQEGLEHAIKLDDPGVTEAFHHAVIVRLGNGTWVVVDPYLDCFGSVDADLMPQLERAKGLLNKYEPVLPGLSLTIANEDGEAIWQQSVAETSSAAIDDTRQMVRLVEQPARKDVFEIMDFLNEVCFDLSYMGYTAQIVLSSDGPAASLDEYYRLWSVSNAGFFLGNGFLPPGLYNDFADSKLSDEQLLKGYDKADLRYKRDSHFARRVNHEMASLVLALYVQDLKKGQEQYLKLPHPTIEVALPHYQAGLMVLNHLRHCVDGMAEFFSPWFSALGSSQILWCDAMLAGLSEEVIFDKMEWQDHLATAKLFATLPDLRLHRLSAQVLSSLDQVPTDNGETYANVS